MCKKKFNLINLIYDFKFSNFQILNLVVFFNYKKKCFYKAGMQFDDGWVLCIFNC